MKKTLLLLILVSAGCTAQNSQDKEALKKCRKEFSKKICLSDKDHDGTPFYLDVCPKEFGSIQNKGCPLQALHHADTTRTAEIEEVFMVGKHKPIGGCGQIISAKLLKTITK
ncbi:hypothetical protein EG347_00545 [Chryseobacterium sp. G0186]|uniref:hypothetical protein n=1 Tax=Chryseobacterium sp. G0186 TaxID=2487064 RepID=UPI000F4D8303|nr:hypothetical protein [Chryseobacterium sp. G0186]AZA76123.1 hypothetical protein EG347_00545 [Chryseobacterium sp. G0186]